MSLFPSDSDGLGLFRNRKPPASDVHRGRRLPELLPLTKGFAASIPISPTIPLGGPLSGQWHLSR
jgi:hypothetical protein